MDAAVRTFRSYRTAGLALATAGVIAAAPVTPAPGGHTVAVRLTAGEMLGDLAGLDPEGLSGLANIPTNLLHDIINIPYNELQSIGFYADALGTPGAVGMGPSPDLPYYTPGPLEPYDGSNPLTGPIGPDHAPEPIGVAGTGSWWMESIGNTWGWDDGNFGQVGGIANMLIPFPTFEYPFAAELQAVAMAEIVANPGACPFACSDLLSYFGGWFKVPLNQLLTGYTLPDDVDPAGQPVAWSGEPIQVDPLYPFTNFFNSLTAPTADNPIEIPTPQDVVQPLAHLAQDLFINDFNPFAIGDPLGTNTTGEGLSFLYWGAPYLYSVPSILAGIVTHLTDGVVKNPFPIPEAGAEASAPGGLSDVLPGVEYGLTHLPNDLEQGVQYLIHGLSQYLDPGTYDLGALSGGTGGLGPADLSSLLGGTDLSSLLGGTNLSSLLGGSDLGALFGAGDLGQLFTDPLQALTSLI